MRKWIKSALIFAASLLMALSLGMAATNVNADTLHDDQALETGYRVRARNCIRWYNWYRQHGETDPYYLRAADNALEHSNEYAVRVAKDKFHNQMNGHRSRVKRVRRHRTVRRYRSAWSKGVPAVLQGNYASYKKSRGFRSMYMIHRDWMSIGLRVGDPMGLGRIYSKKIGYHKYLIHGSNWSQGTYDGFGHSSLIMQRSGRHMYIHYVGANHLQRYYANGSYYKSGYNHMFRVLRSEI